MVRSCDDGCIVLFRPREGNHRVAPLRSLLVLCILLSPIQVVHLGSARVEESVNPRQLQTPITDSLADLGRDDDVMAAGPSNGVMELRGARQGTSLLTGPEGRRSSGLLRFRALPFRGVIDRVVPPIEIEEPEIPDAEAVCPAGCLQEWRADDWCDRECNLAACNYDDGDCEGWCSSECAPRWIGDGECDIDCYTADCTWDGGDCPQYEGLGEPKRDEEQLEDHDFSKCECDMALISNGRCDIECNTHQCMQDGLDCQWLCNNECSNVWLRDGECDRECDFPECYHDKGDCTSCGVGNRCRSWMIDNDVCDLDCMTDDCMNDGNDCDGILDVIAVDYSVEPLVFEFCSAKFVGDGHCDIQCYSEKGLWDGGDCEGADWNALVGQIISLESYKDRGGVLGDYVNRALDKANSSNTTTPEVPNSLEDYRVRTPRMSRRLGESHKQRKSSCTGDSGNVFENRLENVGKKTKRQR